MIVSKKSWHYKLWDRTYTTQYYPPRDLCSYFWRVFWGLALHVGLASAVLFIYIGFPLIFLLTETYLWYQCFWTWYGTAIILLIIVGGCWLGELNLKRKQKRVVSPPSPLIEFIKAKKRKVCPLIEYKD